MPPSKEIIPNEQNQIHTHEFPAQMIGKEAGEGHHLESTGCGLRPLGVLPPSLPRRPPNLLKILQWLPLGGRIKSKLLSPVSKAPVTSCLPLRHSPVGTCPLPTQTYLQVPKCSPPRPPPHAPPPRHSHFSVPLQIVFFLSSTSFPYSICLPSSLS